MRERAAKAIASSRDMAGILLFRRKRPANHILRLSLRQVPFSSLHYGNLILIDRNIAYASTHLASRESGPGLPAPYPGGYPNRTGAALSRGSSSRSRPGSGSRWRPI